MDQARPYLSVVATARNDDHGGNLLGRMQTFVNALFSLAKAHAVPVELILVEWNPPPDRPKLAEALRWPADLGESAVRIIEVPAELHRRYRHAAVLPLYQMIAKNAGIRRARGEFVLATNIDIVLSAELFEFFAARRLRAGRMYRVDRWDTAAEVPVDGPVEEQLAYCRRHLIRVNAREGTFNVTPEGLRTASAVDVVEPSAGIYFGRGWFAAESYSGVVFRWAAEDAELIAVPPDAQSTTLAFDLEPGPGVGGKPFVLQLLDAAGIVLKQVRVFRRSLVRVHVPCQPGGRVSFRLRAVGGGRKTTGDLRILNFRVFRCQWERAHSAAPSSAGLSVETRGGGLRAAARTAAVLAKFGLRGAQVLYKLATAREPMRIGVAISPALAEKTQMRLDGAGLSLTVPPLRRPRKLPPSDQVDPLSAGIIDPGTDLLFGAGWSWIETSAWLTFRWAPRTAEWIVFVPAGEPRKLLVDIEPGPAVGYAPFRLELKNTQGETAAVVQVAGRSTIEVPVPWNPGRSQVLSLHAVGGAAPVAVPGDPRTLCYRVMRVRWAKPAAGAGPAWRFDPSLDLDVVPFYEGIHLGAGWGPLAHTPHGAPFRPAASGAEIVLVSPERDLLIEAEPEPGSAPEAGVEIRDDSGALLLQHRLTGRTPLMIASAALRGRSRVLSLQISGNGSGGALRVHRCDWSGAAAPARDLPCGVLHTNACGDFTLMAREHWLDLRGYAEFDLYSMNIDSVLCYAAHYAGVREEMLEDPIRIYHIEHEMGSGWTPEGQKRLFDRLAARGIGWLDWSVVTAWATEMERLGSTMIFNRDNWGLADEDLPETVFPPRRERGAK